MRTLLLLCSLVTVSAVAGAQGPSQRVDAQAPALRVPIPRDPGSVRTADPADSLYRLARAALNDGDFKRAASLFAMVAERYPDSEFAPDALYYRAYALYRSGTTRELELAVQSLDRQASRYPKAGTLNDAKQLRASLRSEQAKRGDGGAGEEIVVGAQTLSNEKRCPTEDDDMRLAALAGLMQMDADQVLPVLQKLLERKDTCSVSLRRRAVYMVAQTKEEERSDILLRVASTDPSPEVRREAVQWLSQVNTERAARALDSILFNATDADIRDKALYALAQHRSPSARLALRRFAEMPSVPTELRARAIYYIGQGRRSGDESEYLRGLFWKTASPELRESVIQAVANQKTPDRTTWLLGVARDKNQELEPRKKALFYAGQGGVELKELLPLYDELAGQSEMQDQMLYVYAQRKEPEATDKLLQIARSEKNPELRKKAIFWLGQRKDPRVKQFLLDLLNQ
jgi:HEAT repeat protein